ncbi:MAG: hypothetical protein EBX41_09730 [Chitinophagia bacterium]|nr:hypothetical protein [Chitinophagia bacterium]
MNEKEIVAWKGKINFVHRVKIEVLRHFTATHSGNILYADTDVVFTQPLHSIWQQIAKGAKYMHVYEGDIRQRNNPIMKKLDSFLAGFSSPALPSLPTNTAMWNAGLLGFNSDNKQLLDKVLHYTDTVFPHFSKHIVEQFAFSCYFSEEGTLLPAAPYCIHYWNMKEVRKVLEEFVKYSQNLPYQEKLQCFNTIQLPILMQLKGNYYQNLSIIDKLIKKRWQPPSFQAMIGK